MPNLADLLDNALQLEQHLIAEIENKSRVLWQVRGRIATLRELMEAPHDPPAVDDSGPAAAEPADADDRTAGAQ